MVTWVFRNEGERQAFEQIFKDSDRGAGVVAASFVEKVLEQKMSHFFRSDKPAKETQKQLMGRSGALASFSAKIDLGFLLRLYGKRAYKELHTIREIRNDFAHNIEDSNFKSPRISDLCANLKLVDGYFQPMSERERLLNVAGMTFAADMEPIHTYLSEPRNRFLETCGLFVTTFGLGNYAIFAPIYNDDRPGWPVMEWELRHP